MKNKVYKCGICGKEYETIVGRSKCEAACIIKQKENMAKAEEAKKAAEQEVRTKELEDAFKKTNELIDKTNELLAKYLEDYDSFSIDCDCPWFEAINLFGEDENDFDWHGCLFCS